MDQPRPGYSSYRVVNDSVVRVDKGIVSTIYIFYSGNELISSRLLYADCIMKSIQGPMNGVGVGEVCWELVSVLSLHSLPAHDTNGT